MLVNNNSPVQEIIAVEETSKKTTISKTDAKVSRIAKSFFASIGAFIAAPFKFCAKVIKSGFVALISLFKKENKNNPTEEKKEATPSALADEPAKKAIEQEDQDDVQVVEQEDEGDVQVVEQEDQADTEVAEEDVQDKSDYERLNSFAAFVGITSTFIPVICSMFTSSANTTANNNLNSYTLGYVK
jgi:hypothetical protein